MANKNTALSIAKDFEHDDLIVQDQVRSETTGFVHTGEALRRIQESESWAAKFKNFQEYTESRGYSLRDACQMISDAKVAMACNLLDHTKGSKRCPALRDGIRQIGILAKDDPAKQKALFQKCLEDSKVKVINRKVVKEKFALLNSPVDRNVVETTATPVVDRLEQAAPEEPDVDSEPEKLSGYPDSLESDDEPPQKDEATSFDPATFDNATKEGSPDPFKMSKLPPFLIDPLLVAKESRSVQKTLAELMAKAEELATRPGGSWMAGYLQENQRLLGQVRSNFKATTYSCLCPKCKNNPERNCVKCGGRGFLDHSHYAKLCEADQKWVLDNKPITD